MIVLVELRRWTWQSLTVVLRAAGEFVADPNPMPRIRLWGRRRG